jgi:hypothetical protein
MADFHQSRLDFRRLSNKTLRTVAGDGREHGLAVHSEGSEASRRSIVDDKQSEIRQRYLGTGVAFGSAFGVAIGAGFGVAFGNLALGIGLGISLGVALGIAVGSILGNQHAKGGARTIGYRWQP